MQINCDLCKGNFVLKPLLKNHPDGIEEVYFTCPHCDNHYTGSVTNGYIRSIQKQVRELQRRKNILAKTYAGRFTDKDSINKFEQSIKKIDSEIESKGDVIEKEMNKLKAVI